MSYSKKGNSEIIRVQQCFSSVFFFIIFKCLKNDQVSHQNHLHCTHFGQFIKNSLLHIVMDEKRRRYPRIIIKTYLYLSPDEQFRWMYIYPSWTKSKNIHWSIIVSRKVISTPTESRFFKIQKKINRYNECSFKYFWTEGSRNGIAFLCPRDECHFLLFYMLHGKMAIRRLFVYVNTNKFSFTFWKVFIQRIMYLFPCHIFRFLPGSDGATNSLAFRRNSRIDVFVFNVSIFWFMFLTDSLPKNAYLLGNQCH